MSFIASNNRISITNTQGKVVFDTNNKMPVILQTLTGRATVKEGNQVLGKIDPSNTFLFPVFKYLSSQGSITSDHYEIGLNSRLYNCGWARIPVIGGNGSISYVNTTLFSTFSFLIVGDSVVLNGFVNGGGLNFDIQYKILVGRVF